MNKTKIRKLMKENGYVEINDDEDNEILNVGECKFYFEDGNIYFAPKEYVPKIKMLRMWAGD